MMVLACCSGVIPATLLCVVATGGNLLRRYQRHYFPRKPLHRRLLFVGGGGREAEDEMGYSQVLVLAQVGGDLLRPPRHQPAVVSRVIQKDAIGAEHQVDGVLGAAGPNTGAAQLGDFF